MAFARQLQPELLDHLDPADPEAIGSRADLRRLNRLMRSASTLAHALRGAAPNPRAPLLELGAGDAWLAVQIARRLGPDWRGTRLTLIDRIPLPPGQSQAELQQLGWDLTSVQDDALDYLQHTTGPVPMVFTNLFLHHLDQSSLTRLFQLLAQKACAFIALEPRRTLAVRLLSRCVGLIGCNRVTRHDAPVSVEAGFRGHELSQLWGRQPGWNLEERETGLFSHLFIAVRRTAP